MTSEESSLTSRLPIRIFFRHSLQSLSTGLGNWLIVRLDDYSSSHFIEGRSILLIDSNVSRHRFHHFRLAWATGRSSDWANAAPLMSQRVVASFFFRHRCGGCWLGWSPTNSYPFGRSIPFRAEALFFITTSSQRLSTGMGT